MMTKKKGTDSATRERDIFETRSSDDFMQCSFDAINGVNEMCVGYIDMKCYAAMLLQEIRNINRDVAPVGLIGYYEQRADELGLDGE